MKHIKYIHDHFAYPLAKICAKQFKINLNNKW